MILLIAENFDKSMFRIMEWLTFYETKHVVIFQNSTVNILEVIVDNGYAEMIINIDGEIVKLSTISSYYWRRADYFYIWNREKERKSVDVESFYGFEYQSLGYLFHYLLSLQKGIGKNNIYPINKLKALIVAKRVGFSIPESKIVTTKDQIISFMIDNEVAFSKPIRDFRNFEKNKKKFTFQNRPLIYEEILKGENEYYHSLIQKYIKKKYELRVFVYKTKAYAMAIFSQKNEMTRYDYRQYSVIVPYVPYKLTSEAQEKIQRFMNEMDLDTGSFDFIVDENNDLCFLEVNPVGIFDMVTSPCNYHIEKDIAEYLIQLK